MPEFIQIIAILVPILGCGFGVYVKIREEITELKIGQTMSKEQGAEIKDIVFKLSDDVNNLAFLMGTKRSISERKKK